MLAAKANAIIELMNKIRNNSMTSAIFLTIYMLMGVAMSINAIFI